MAILEKLKDRKSINSTESNIINFILENPREVTQLTIGELAVRTYSSKASIVRVCQKIGLKGFSELKIQIAREMNAFVMEEARIEADIPFEADLDLKSIATKVFNLQYQAMADTYYGLDLEELYRAAKLVEHSDLVLLYGRGESLLPLKSLQADLTRIGKRSFCETFIGYESVYPFQDKINCCAIILSQFADSRMINRTIQELRQLKIPIILIHGNRRNLLLKLVDISISFDNTESHSKMASCASRATKHFIIALLYYLVFSIRYEKNMNTLLQHSKLVAARKEYLGDNA